MHITAPRLIAKQMDDYVRQIDFDCWLEEDDLCIGSCNPESCVLCGVCCAPLGMRSLKQHFRAIQHKANEERWKELLQDYENSKFPEGKKRTQTPPGAALGTIPFLYLLPHFFPV
jgi:hypothetical protein